MHWNKAKSKVRAIGAQIKARVLSQQNYEVRLAAEQEAYRDCLNVHELPAIFHYWSNRYLRPKLEAFGFSGPTGFFETYLQRQCSRQGNLNNQFISIGSGNCDLEIELSRNLVSQGIRNFRLECLDLNKDMLQRGRQMADEQGLSSYLAFTQSDFNHWRPTHKFDAVIANQSLHHVLEVNNLLSSVKRALSDDAVFLISDMVGRNGHLRWPEALAIVQEFWQELPAAYRYNHQLKRHEEQYENWDCSTEGFEGIRAQDILPTLNRLFQFELFIPFANIIDIFVDRAFGHNFDPARDWDRNFIDRVHERDEQEFRSGKVKPTHLIAVARLSWKSELQHHKPLTPDFSVRYP